MAVPGQASAEGLARAAMHVRVAEMKVDVPISDAKRRSWSAVLSHHPSAKRGHGPLRSVPHEVGARGQALCALQGGGGLARRALASPPRGRLRKASPTSMSLLWLARQPSAFARLIATSARAHARVSFALLGGSHCRWTEKRRAKNNILGRAKACGRWHPRPGRRCVIQGALARARQPNREARPMHEALWKRGRAAKRR